ncbi:MAG: DUF4372 domain-containing protein [Desulfobulbaceae bacterium]|nr:DUF4372 domain-containing protein [Desulfobulbaceae bacterium]
MSQYHDKHKVEHFSCHDQYLSMLLGQFTYRESLRVIETCRRAQKSKLCHIEVRGGISGNMLANANRTRDWCICIYTDFIQVFICIARKL